MRRDRPTGRRRNARLLLVLLSALGLGVLVAAAAGPSGAVNRIDDVGSASSGRVLATHVAPVLGTGNPTCPAGTTELKIEPVADGTFSDGTLTVTIDVRNPDAGPVF